MRDASEGAGRSSGASMRTQRGEVKMEIEDEIVQAMARLLKLKLLQVVVLLHSVLNMVALPLWQLICH